MKTRAGIKYSSSILSKRRYVSVDLDTYGNYQALEDFLDIADAEARQSEPTLPMDAVIAHENQRRGIQNV